MREQFSCSALRSAGTGPQSHSRRKAAGRAGNMEFDVGSSFWQLMMGDASDAYYAHPWAWDEIGFGGPAYPRAYTRLERGEPEPWEVEEKRYEWLAPESAVSHEVKSAAHLHTEADQHRLITES